METQSRVCFHCVRTEHPWNHMYVLRIQTRGSGNTLHALLLSTVLSFREDSAVTLTVSLSLVTSLSLPLPFALQYGLFTKEFLIHGDSLSVSTTARYPLSFFSVCGSNDCRAKPAASRLTGKSQAELAALLVNNKSQLRQSTSAGMYHRLYRSRFILISLRPINENESSADCAVGD